MDPSNTSAKKELIDVQRNIKEKKENEKKNYANLFSGNIYSLTHSCIDSVTKSLTHRNVYLRGS